MAFKHTFICNKEGECDTRNLTAAKAIRFKCLECSNFSASDVRECAIKTCALWPFRFGKTGIKRKLTKEQRKDIATRLEKSRRRRNG